MRQCSSLQMILFYNFENEITVIIAKKNWLKCLKFLLFMTLIKR